MGSKWMVACALVIAPVLGPSIAAADPTAQERNIAQTLFDAARKLMNAGRVAEACSKFDESQRLDPSTGTLLNLAVCREKEGKLASAWEQFREAAASAKRDGQAERERYASQRASSLEPRLSRVTVTVSTDADAPGLSVQVDGVAVQRAVWGTAIAVDGGSHTVAARANGRVPWQTSIDVAPERDTKAVQVPPLVAETPTAPAPAPTIAPPPAPAPPLAVPDDERGLTGTQIGGLVMGGAGLAAVTVGAVFGVMTGAAVSRQKNDCASPTNCPNHAQALQDHDTVNTDSVVSTIAFAVGGAALAGGLVLFLSGGRSERGAEGSALVLRPTFDPRGAGLHFGGSF
jgi:hypothetical protein